eukprot:GHVS01071829.1.p1 GENE.GHVS01071829.1~~GHVS01071829.1.p1  ORF type:complete len:272 (+),score=26.32 GHVS01071829.1:3-818(+)
MLAAGRVPCYFILCFLLLEATPQTRKVAMGYLLDAPPAAEGQNHHQPRKLGVTDVVAAGVTTVPSGSALTTTTPFYYFIEPEKPNTGKPKPEDSVVWGRILPNSKSIDLFTEKWTHKDHFIGRMTKALQKLDFPVVLYPRNNIHTKSQTWCFLVRADNFVHDLVDGRVLGYRFNYYRHAGTLNKKQRSAVLNAAFKHIILNETMEMSRQLRRRYIGQKKTKSMTTSSASATARPDRGIIFFVALLALGVFSFVGFYAVVVIEVNHRKPKKE